MFHVNKYSHDFAVINEIHYLSIAELFPFFLNESSSLSNDNFSKNCFCQLPLEDAHSPLQVSDTVLCEMVSSIHNALRKVIYFWYILLLESFQ